MQLPMLPQDKANHVVVGVAICAAVTSITWLVSYPTPAQAAAVGALVTAFVGAIKEAYDDMHRDKDSPELADFLATTAGGALVALPVFIMGAGL